MRVRRTTDAADELERIRNYIAEATPDSARRTARTIVDGIASLHTFPNRGRPGRVEGTREIVFTPLPFVAVYDVRTRCAFCESCTARSSGHLRSGPSRSVSASTQMAYSLDRRS
jgi:plasmid stabilization system protein ParE